MTPLNSGFPVPLTSTAWNAAQRYVQPQFDADHNQQQFRNGLALYAVDFYLKCMAVEVESKSHPVLAQLVEGAALTVKNLGQLECCPVQSGETKVQVPMDAWCDRIAYVIVHIEDHLKQAHILGFSPQPISAKGEIDLGQLQAIETLPQYLDECQTTALSQVWSWARAQGAALAESVGTLHGWQSTQTLHLAFMGEASDLGDPRQASDDHALVSKAVQLEDLDLELVMDLSPKAEGSLRIELMVEAEQPLPKEVQLAIIDETGQVFQTLSPKDDLMAHPFSAASSEQFSIELSYGQAEHTETFVV